MTVEPGSYEVMATPARQRRRRDLEQDGVNFAAGTASTVYAVGSGGERARFVVVQDGVDAPEGGPATGLGGLSGDDGPPGSRRCSPRSPPARSAAWPTCARRAAVARRPDATRAAARALRRGWPPRSCFPR